MANRGGSCRASGVGEFREVEYGGKFEDEDHLLERPWEGSFFSREYDVFFRERRRQADGSGMTITFGAF